LNPPDKPEAELNSFQVNNAKIAQLVERHLAKVEVAGSNPVFRSRFNEIRRIFETQY